MIQSTSVAGCIVSAGLHSNLSWSLSKSVSLFLLPAAVGLWWYCRTRTSTTPASQTATWWSPGPAPTPTSARPKTTSLPSPSSTSARWAIRANVKDLAFFLEGEFNSIQFYLYSTKSIQLSQGSRIQGLNNTQIHAHCLHAVVGFKKKVLECFIVQSPVFVLFKKIYISLGWLNWGWYCFFKCGRHFKVGHILPFFPPDSKGSEDDCMQQRQ